MYGAQEAGTRGPYAQHRGPWEVHVSRVPRQRLLLLGLPVGLRLTATKTTEAALRFATGRPLLGGDSGHSAAATLHARLPARRRPDGLPHRRRLLLSLLPAHLLVLVLVVFVQRAHHL